jgi:peptidoglycan-associated lipoprotein
MNRQALVLGTLVVVGLACGCAQRPTATTAAAPPPAALAATKPPAEAAAGSQTTGSATTNPADSASGGTAPGSSSEGTTTSTSARPVPGEFQPLAELRDVHFDFDRYVIRPDGARILDRNAAWHMANADHLILIEGHCDERGTSEYNLALGERRAHAALNYLVARGVSARRITIVSYGEEQPQCKESTEDCWAKNRRTHFLVKRQ